MKLKRVLIGLSISAGLFFLPFVTIHAQSVTPASTPEPTVSPITSPAPVSDLSNKVITDVETFLGTYGALVGTMTLFIVGLLKNVPFLSNVNPRYINIGVSGVLVIGFLLASNFGYGAKYAAALDALPRVGEILLGLLASFGFSTSFHEAAKTYGLAGASKTA